MDKEQKGVFDVSNSTFNGTEIYEFISPYIFCKINKDTNTYIWSWHIEGWRTYRGARLKKNEQQTKEATMQTLQKPLFDIVVICIWKRCSNWTYNLILNTPNFSSYVKPNIKLQYINAGSNHAKIVIKHVTKSMNVDYLDILQKIVLKKKRKCIRDL